MKTLTIQLSDETASRLEALADQLGMSLEEVAQISIDDQLKRLDHEYDEAAKEVLSKNAELYRRLSFRARWSVRRRSYHQWRGGARHCHLHG